MNAWRTFGTLLSRRQALQSHIASADARTGDLSKARWLVTELGSAVFDQGAHVLAPALVAFYSGDWQTAAALWRTAYERNRRTGSRWGQTDFAVWLARLCHVQGDAEQAGALSRETLAVAVAGPSLPYELHARTQLARLAAEHGNPAAAREHVHRCTEILAAGEEWRGLAGRVALAEAVVVAAGGDPAAAAARFEQARQTFRRYTLPWEEAESLHLWGRALLAAGETQQALEKFDAALAIYESCGAGQRWREHVLLDRRQAEPHRHVEAVSPRYPNGLSAREVEVLRLVSTGKSNREIAETLVISVNTVLQHMRSIFNKTGAGNRTEAAAYAYGHGLAGEPRP